MSCTVKYIYRAPLALAAAAFATLLVAACQSEAPGPELSDEEAVSQRAEAWWQAMQERDYGQAWEYLTPGFRQETPRERYIADRSNRRLQYLEARVVGAECDDDRCEVAVEVTYRPTGAPAGLSDAKMMRTNTEQWIRIDGQWWRPSSR